MPNWDLVCPQCGERGSFLDFEVRWNGKRDERIYRCPDPECGYWASQEKFCDPTYYE